MKFQCSVTINKPLDQVIKTFENTDNLKEWQDGFQSYERLSGDVGKPGAKSLFVYKNGKHIIELTETIQVSNLPQEMTAQYEHKHMSNTMTNHFEALSDIKTKYDVSVGYIKFNGLMPKLMGMFMGGVFKKQTQKWLDNFKAFAEK